jgi:tetratricopeptide (TPR) repeat protein
MPLLRMLSSSAIAALLLAWSPVARADPAAAEALFREGRALLQRGDVQVACDKLQASNALDPSAGTLLNLAACRLRQGKTATAWAHFIAAERLAENQGRDEQAREAKRRAQELEPTLSTLTLQAAEAPPGVELRRGGQPIQAGSLGSPVPVDPGPLLIEASAPGYETARLNIDIGSGERRVISLPRLKQLPPPRSVPSPPPLAARADAGTPRTVAPWLIGGVGGAALAAGSVLGILALSSNSNAIDVCHGTDQARCDGAQARRDNQALASTISVAAGLAGIGVAAVWLVTARSGRPANAWSYHGEVTRQSALLHMRVGF